MRGSGASAGLCIETSVNLQMTLLNSHCIWQGSIEDPHLTLLVSCVQRHGILSRWYLCSARILYTFCQTTFLRTQDRTVVPKSVNNWLRLKLCLNDHTLMLILLRNAVVIVMIKLLIAVKWDVKSMLTAWYLPSCLQIVQILTNILPAWCCEMNCTCRQ